MSEVAGLEVGEVVGGCGRTAGGLGDQIGGVEGGAVGVDVFPQPGEQWRVVGGISGGGDGRVLAGGGEELGGVDVAE